MSESIEKLIYDWLSAIVAAAAMGSPLFEVQVSASSYEAIGQDRVIQIGPTKSKLKPNADQEIEEFRAQTGLVFLSRVTDINDKALYAAGLNDIVSMAKAVVAILAQDPMLAGGGEPRCEDMQWGEFLRTVGDIKGNAFAVGNLPIFANTVGEQVVNI